MHVLLAIVIVHACTIAIVMLHGLKPSGSNPLTISVVADTFGVSTFSHTAKFESREPCWNALARIRNGSNAKVLEMSQLGWYARANLDSMTNSLKCHQLSKAYSEHLCDR